MQRAGMQAHKLFLTRLRDGSGRGHGWGVCRAAKEFTLYACLALAALLLLWGAVVWVFGEEHPHLQQREVEAAMRKQRHSKRVAGVERQLRTGEL